MMMHNAGKQSGFFTYALKNYLFVRIPLCRPDRILERLKPYNSFLFHKMTRTLFLILGVIGSIMVIRDLDQFVAGFYILQNPTGITLGLLALALAKIIHELGHAFACKYYGCKVPTMGVAFIVLWPLLWTETTDAWRLTDNKKRLAINGAGMTAELWLAAISSILWAVSPEGSFKDMMHMLAGVTWMMTLFVNLNPFMRFDGYYLLSDMLDIPNLQERSFKISKSWIRQTCWGYDDGHRSVFSPRLNRWLIAYSIGTWIYRFFLFLGIALLVYHYFFKALGVFLMVIELWWFIAIPIIREMKHWIMNRDKINISSFKAILSITVLGIFFFVPWQSYVFAPAIFKSTQEIPLFSADNASIQSVNVTSGQSVKQGEILFVLKNKDLEHQITLAQKRAKSLETEIRNKSVERIHYRDSRLLAEELQKTAATLTLETARQKDLIIRAPIDGIIVDIPDHIMVSQWISKREYLGLIKSHDNQVEAFVQEDDLARIAVGNKAILYSQSTHLQALNGQINRIDAHPAKYIPYPELGADQGGPIAMNAQSADQNLMPLERHYKLVINWNNQSDETLPYHSTFTGTARLSAKPESLAYKTIRKAASIIIQESGL